MPHSRRTVLGTVSAAAVALAGCGASEQESTTATTTATPTRSTDSSDTASGTDTATTTETESTTTSATTQSEVTPPPTRDDQYYIPYEFEHLRENIRSGGVPKDGIPSIDEPNFAPPDQVKVAPGDPVFGVVRNGVAKAYPQQVVVFHEIVNDVIGGEPVSVTYCPLTGTVQGFPRGPTTFGVSGDLLNNNLVMYDRSTDSRIPQMLATAVKGPMTGQSLQEFRVIWTTKELWVSAHPDTTILTRDTGYVRRYGNDPYGSYNPRGGYYESGGGLIPSLHTDDRADPKDVVIGARTEKDAIAVRQDHLLESRVVPIETDITRYVAVSDPDLDTGYVYLNPDDTSVSADGEAYTVSGQSHAPDDLPLDGVIAFDAMWHAWAGFYPETAYVD